MFIALGLDQSSRAILGVAVAWGVSGMTALEYGWMLAVGFPAAVAALSSLPMFLEGDIIDGLFQLSLAGFLSFFAAIPLLVPR